MRATQVARTIQKERSEARERRVRRRQRLRQTSAGKVELRARTVRFGEKISKPAIMLLFQTSPERSSQRPNHNQPDASTDSVPDCDNATIIRDWISRIGARYRARTTTSRRSKLRQ